MKARKTKPIALAALRAKIDKAVSDTAEGQKRHAALRKIQWMLFHETPNGTRLYAGLTLDGLACLVPAVSDLVQVFDGRDNEEAKQSCHESYLGVELQFAEVLT